MGRFNKKAPVVNQQVTTHSTLESAAEVAARRLRTSRTIILEALERSCEARVISNAHHYDIKVGHPNGGDGRARIAVIFTPKTPSGQQREMKFTVETSSGSALCTRE